MPVSDTSCGGAWRSTRRLELQRRQDGPHTWRRSQRQQRKNAHLRTDSQTLSEEWHERKFWVGEQELTATAFVVIHPERGGPYDDAFANIERRAGDRPLYDKVLHAEELRCGGPFASLRRVRV